ncbi:MAG: SoxY-related AACIE arm protein [Caldimonas sp.]
MERRQLLFAGAAWCVVASQPAAAASAELQAAVRDFTGGETPRQGRVQLDVAPLVENGNTVPLGVSADSPMTPADHVSAIAIFNERNPQRDVAVFHLTPRCGRASVSTRIRLANSQTLVAVARMSDGSYWTTSLYVIVTLAGCIDGS